MCKYCEWQDNDDDIAYIQDSGKKMYVCNSDQLVIEDDDENVVSSATINNCPMCGRDL